MRVSVALLGLIFIMPMIVPTHAAEVEIKSAIDRVTVTPDAAMVTRLARINLVTGVTQGILRNLPSAVDPESIRISASGTVPFTINGIDLRPAFAETPAPVSPPGISRQELQQERDTLKSRIESLEARKASILRFSQSSPEKLGDESKPLEVGRWVQVWDIITKEVEATNAGLIEARNRLSETETRLSALTVAGAPERNPERPLQDAVIVLETDQPWSGNLTITYRVPARWTPYYEARLDISHDPGAEPSLDLALRAKIFQETGEDWNNAALTLSTARVVGATKAPDLPVQSAMLTGIDPLKDRPEAIPGDAAKPAEPIEPPPATMAEPPTDEPAGIQAAFAVPGRNDVPSSSKEKDVRLGNIRVKPDLTVKAAPLLDLRAYVVAAFDHDSGTPLLSGPVFLYRNDTYVGRGRIPFTPGGERLRLGFGLDPGVTVTRTTLHQTQDEPGFLSTMRKTNRTYRISVINRHPFPARITVTDRIPHSATPDFQVALLPDNTPPTVRNPDGQMGLLEWTYIYQPGERKDITLSYRMTWPTDRRPVFRNEPAR